MHISIEICTNNIYGALIVLNVSFVVDVEHSHVRFLGNLVLNLWDCGGYERLFCIYICILLSKILHVVETEYDSYF